MHHCSNVNKQKISDKYFQLLDKTHSNHELLSVPDDVNATSAAYINTGTYKVMHPQNFYHNFCNNPHSDQSPIRFFCKPKSVHGTHVRNKSCWGIVLSRKRPVGETYCLGTYKLTRLAYWLGLPRKWLGHWSSSDIMSKSELISFRSSSRY